MAPSCSMRLAAMLERAGPPLPSDTADAAASPPAPPLGPASMLLDTDCVIEALTAPAEVPAVTAGSKTSLHTCSTTASAAARSRRATLGNMAAIRALLVLRPEAGGCVCCALLPLLLLPPSASVLPFAAAAWEASEGASGFELEGRGRLSQSDTLGRSSSARRCAKLDHQKASVGSSQAVGMPAVLIWAAIRRSKCSAKSDVWVGPKQTRVRASRLAGPW